MDQKYVFGFIVALMVITIPCQSKGVSRVKRVIGGNEFDAGKWPWLVSLQGEVPSRTFFGIPISWRTFYCGASIINDQWLVTAAHCFTENNLGSRARAPQYWHARLGDIELDPGLIDQAIGWFAGVLEIDEFRSWFLHAEEVILHPEYDPSSLWLNDIALIKLEEPVPISALETPEIQAVKLPISGNLSFPRDNQRCIMKGWGCSTNGGPVSDTAREVDLPKVSDSVCTSFWGITATSRLCAGYDLEDMGICSGDSGGPLVCQNERQEWVQVGIASFTSANQPGNVPGVFTRVSNYVDWIQDTIRENS